MTDAAAITVQVVEPSPTDRRWVLSAGDERVGEIIVHGYSSREASVEWDLTPDALRSAEVQRIVLGTLEQLFAEPETVRAVHRCAEGDYADLRFGRSIGFLPEGFERVRRESGRVVQLWRSALLRGEVPAMPQPVGAQAIDGSRPQHLVAEFHEVYHLPNTVAAGAAPTVDHSRIDMRMSLIKEEFSELCGAVYGEAAEKALVEFYPTIPDDHSRDVVEAADALADLVYVVYGMALESGIDLDKVLAEVHRSNLSKLMPDGSVKWREDGKVLKGPDFSEPNIAGAMGMWE